MKYAHELCPCWNFLRIPHGSLPQFDASKALSYEPLLHDGGRIAGDHRAHRAAQQDGTTGAAEVVAIQGQGNLGARVSGAGWTVDR